MENIQENLFIVGQDVLNKIAVNQAWAGIENGTQVELAGETYTFGSTAFASTGTITEEIAATAVAYTFAAFNNSYGNFMVVNDASVLTDGAGTVTFDCLTFNQNVNIGTEETEYVSDLAVTGTLTNTNGYDFSITNSNVSAEKADLLVGEENSVSLTDSALNATMLTITCEEPANKTVYMESSKLYVDALSSDDLTDSAIDINITGVNTIQIKDGAIDALIFDGNENDVALTDSTLNLNKFTFKGTQNDSTVSNSTLNVASDFALKNQRFHVKDSTLDLKSDMKIIDTTQNGHVIISGISTVNAIVSAESSLELGEDAAAVTLKDSRILGDHIIYNTDTLTLDNTLLLDVNYSIQQDTLTGKKVSLQNNSTLYYKQGRNLDNSEVTLGKDSNDTSVLIVDNGKMNLSGTSKVSVYGNATINAEFAGASEANMVTLTDVTLSNTKLITDYLTLDGDTTLGKAVDVTSNKSNLSVIAEKKLTLEAGSKLTMGTLTNNGTVMGYDATINGNIANNGDMELVFKKNDDFGGDINGTFTNNGGNTIIRGSGTDDATDITLHCSVVNEKGAVSIGSGYDLSVTELTIAGDPKDSGSWKAVTITNKDKMELAGHVNVTGKVKNDGTLTVTDDVQISKAFTNTGTLHIDCDASLSFKTLSNTGTITVYASDTDAAPLSFFDTDWDNTSGTITVDMTGKTGLYYKIVDYTGSDDPGMTVDAYNVSFVEGSQGDYQFYVADNDLYASRVAPNTLEIAFNHKWEGTAAGTEVVLNGQSYIYGETAFSDTDCDGALSLLAKTSVFAYDDTPYKYDQLNAITLATVGGNPDKGKLIKMTYLRDGETVPLGTIRDADLEFVGSSLADEVAMFYISTDMNVENSKIWLRKVTNTGGYVSTPELVVQANATLSVYDDSKIDLMTDSGTVVNMGTISVEAGSKIMTSKYSSESTGCISIEVPVTAKSETYTIIDADDGTTYDLGKITMSNEGTAKYVLDTTDGDLKLLRAHVDLLAENDSHVDYYMSLSEAIETAGSGRYTFALIDKDTTESGNVAILSDKTLDVGEYTLTLAEGFSNDGSVEMDAVGKIIAETVQNNGTITVNMFGAEKDSYELIKCTGSSADYGIYQFTEGYQGNYKFAIYKNNLYAIDFGKVDTTTLKVNAAWNSYAVGTKIAGLNNYKYGFNAFDIANDASNAVTDKTTTIEFYGPDSVGDFILSDKDYELTLKTNNGTAKFGIVTLGSADRKCKSAITLDGSIMQADQVLTYAMSDLVLKNNAQLSVADTAGLTNEGAIIVEYGSTITVSNTFSNYGTIALDAVGQEAGTPADAKITAKSIDNTLGTITIDMTGANDIAYHLVKVDAMAEKYFEQLGFEGPNYVFSNDAGKYSFIALRDGLYAINRNGLDFTTLKVNAAWQGRNVGDEVEDGYYYGINAFGYANDAVSGMLEETTTLSLAGSDTSALQLSLVSDVIINTTDDNAFDGEHKQPAQLDKISLEMVDESFGDITVTAGSNLKVNELENNMGRLNILRDGETTSSIFINGNVTSSGEILVSSNAGATLTYGGKWVTNDDSPLRNSGSVLVDVDYMPLGLTVGGATVIDYYVGEDNGEKQYAELADYGIVSITGEDRDTYKAAVVEGSLVVVNKYYNAVATTHNMAGDDLIIKTATTATTKEEVAFKDKAFSDNGSVEITNDGKGSAIIGMVKAQGDVTVTAADGSFETSIGRIEAGMSNDDSFSPVNSESNVTIRTEAPTELATEASTEGGILIEKITSAGSVDIIHEGANTLEFRKSIVAHGEDRVDGTTMTIQNINRDSDLTVDADISVANGTLKILNETNGTVALSDAGELNAKNINVINTKTGTIDFDRAINATGSIVIENTNTSNDESGTFDFGAVTHKAGNGLTIINSTANEINGGIDENGNIRAALFEVVNGAASINNEGNLKIDLVAMNSKVSITNDSSGELYSSEIEGKNITITNNALIEDSVITASGTLTLQGTGTIMESTISAKTIKCSGTNHIKLDWNGNSVITFTDKFSGSLVFDAVDFTGEYPFTEDKYLLIDSVNGTGGDYSGVTIKNDDETNIYKLETIDGDLYVVKNLQTPDISVMVGESSSVFYNEQTKAYYVGDYLDSVSATLTVNVIDRSGIGIDSESMVYTINGLTETHYGNGEVITLKNAVDGETYKYKFSAKNQKEEDVQPEDYCTREIIYTVDKSGPVIGTIEDADYVSNDVFWFRNANGSVESFGVEVTDAGSGVKSVSFEWCGVTQECEFKDGKYIVPIMNTLEPVPNTYTITATDNLGNVTSRDITIGLDGSSVNLNSDGYQDNFGVKWYKQNAEVTIGAKITDWKTGERTAWLQIGDAEPVIYELDSAVIVDTSKESETIKGIAYTFTASDQVGNNATPVTQMIGIDGTGPKIDPIVLNPLESEQYVDANGIVWYKQGSEAKISADISDRLSGVKESTLNGNAYISGQQVVIETDKETNGAVYAFTAVDNVGNETAATKMIGVDGTGPVIEAPVISEGYYYDDETAIYWFQTGASATIASYVHDELSGADKAWLQIGTDKAEYISNTPATIITTAETDVKGVEYTFTALDNVGNEAVPVSCTIGVDETGPQIEYGITAEAYYDEATDISWYKMDSASYVYAMITDSHSGVNAASITLNGEAYTIGTQFEIAKEEHENPITYTFYAEDNVGNSTSVTVENVPQSTVSKKISVDGTPVEVGSFYVSGEHTYQVAAGTWIKAGTDFTIGTTVTDALTGVKENTVNLNGATLTRSENDLFSKVFNESAETALTGWDFSASDNVGNTKEITAALSIGIDGSGPSILVAQDSAIVPSPAVTVTATFDDNQGSGVAETTAQYRIGEGDWTAYTTGFTVTQNCTVSFKVQDNVGNVTIVTQEVWMPEADPVIDNTTMVITEDCMFNSIIIRNSGALIVESGSVTTETLTIEGADNMISGNTVAAETITLAEGSGLSLNKDQYDRFMADSAFAEGSAGTLYVSSVSENAVRTQDIDTLMNKANVNNVQFIEQNLVDIKELKIKNTDAKVIGFEDACGTAKNDAIRFYKDTNVVFGNEGREIDLKEGNNTIQIDKNAETTIKSNLTNVSTVTAAAGSTVNLADVDFQAGRDATLKAEGSSFQAGAISGTDKKNTITIGKNTAFESGAITLADKGDKLTANSGSTVYVGSTEGEVFTGATIAFNDGSDTLNAKGSNFVAGTVNFGDGNDTLTTGTASVFAAIARKNGDWETTTDVQYADINFGDGNDKLSAGKNSALAASAVNSAETISLGAYSKMQVVKIEGTKKLTISNGKEGQIATLKAAEVTGTAANDTFSLGNWNDVDFASLDLGDGNDTLKIGNYADVDISSLDFGEGAKDKLTIGKGATLSVDTLDVDSLDSLVMAKDSRIEIADADDLADAQQKWSKYSDRIVSKIA